VIGPVEPDPSNVIGEPTSPAYGPPASATGGATDDVTVRLRALFVSFDSLTCCRSSAVAVNVSGLAVNGRDSAKVWLAPATSWVK